MCTLLIARNLFKFYPLVVAANRDERRHRPSSSPKIWEGSPSMLAPVDDVFGGTWIGANQSGVTAAITNRPSVPHISGRLSRGALIPIVLESRSATEALSRIVEMEGTLFNGFHLAIVDQQEGYVALGDGHTIVARPMPDGFTVITERGWEPEHSERALRIESIFRKEVRGHPPRTSTFAPLLNLHDRSHAEAGETGACLHGAPDDEWVTKSSSLLRIQDRKRDDGTLRRYWEFFHRERAEGRPNCESPWDLYQLDLE